MPAVRLPAHAGVVHPKSPGAHPPGPPMPSLRTAYDHAGEAMKAVFPRSGGFPGRENVFLQEISC